MKSSLAVRITSFFTLVFFVASGAGWPALSIRDFDISAEHGDVVARYESSSSHLRDDSLAVIHIQDAHESLHAQMKIKAIVEELADRERIDLMGIEGAMGTFPEYQDLNQLPLKEAREKVTEFYVEKGFLSGAEQAGITASRPIEVVGLENKKEFDQSFQLFNQLQEKRSAFEDLNREFLKALAVLKSKAFNPALREFDRQVSDVEAHRINIADWIRMLDDYRLRLAIQAPVFQNIVATRAFIETANAKSPLASSSVRADPRVRPIGPAQGPALTSFAGVARELTELTLLIKKTLASTPDEQEIVRMEQTQKTLLRFLLLEAERADVKKFFADRQNHSIYALAGRIREWCEKYRVLFDFSAPEDSGVYVDASARFYKLAEARDRILAHRLIRHMKKSGKKKAILVSGGYHTEGLAGYFKKKGVSYAVITPKIDRPEKDLPVTERMTGKLFSLTHILQSYFTALTKPLNPSVHAKMVGDIRKGILNQTAFVLGRPDTLFESRNIDRGTYDAIQRVLQRVNEDSFLWRQVQAARDDYEYFNRYVCPKLERMREYEKVVGSFLETVVEFLAAREGYVHTAIGRARGPALTILWQRTGSSAAVGLSSLLLRYAGFGADAYDQRIIREKIVSARSAGEQRLNAGAALDAELRKVADEVAKQFAPAESILLASRTVKAYVQGGFLKAVFGVVFIKDFDGLGRPNAKTESFGGVDVRFWPTMRKPGLALIKPSETSPLQKRLGDQDIFFSHVDFLVDDVEGFRMAAEKAVSNGEVNWAVDDRTRNHVFEHVDGKQKRKIKSFVITDKETGIRIALVQYADENSAFPRRPWKPKQVVSAGAEAYHKTGRHPWHIRGFEIAADIIQEILNNWPSVLGRVRMLDLGIGTGLATEALEARIQQLGLQADHVGVDVKEEWPAKAYQIFVANNPRGNVQIYIQRNLITREIEKDLVVALGEGVQFDLVHALNVIHLIPDTSVPQAFTNVANALRYSLDKPFVTSSGNIKDPTRHGRGHLIIDDLVQGIRREAFDVIAADANTVEYLEERFDNLSEQRHAQLRTRQRIFPPPRPQSFYDKHLRETGFEPGPVRVEPIEDTKAHWKEFILSPDLWNGILPELGDDKAVQERILSEAADRFFANFPGESVTLQWAFQVSKFVGKPDAVPGAVGFGFNESAEEFAAIFEKHLDVPFNSTIEIVHLPRMIALGKQSVSIEIPAEVILRHMPFAPFLKGKHAFSWARLLSNDRVNIKIGVSSRSEIALVKERIGYDQNFFTETARGNIAFVPALELDSKNIVIVKGSEFDAKLLKLPVGEYLRLIELLPHFLLAIAELEEAAVNPAIFHLEGDTFRVDVSKLEALTEELRSALLTHEAVLAAA